MKARKKFFRGLMVAAASVFALSLIGCERGGEDVKEGQSSSVTSSLASSVEEKIDFKAIALSAGFSEGDACLTFGSDGSYCTIDTNPYDLEDYSRTYALTAIEKFNKELGLPEYVYQEMVTTSYLQGKQTVTVGDITVTWYYHPDKGLNATYKLAW